MPLSQREGGGGEKERDVQALTDTLPSQLGLFCFFWLAPITYDTVNAHDKGSK